MNDVWSNRLSMRYRGGEPLRPPTEAAQIFYDAATPFLNPDAAKNEIVLLGVTPELALLPWPKNTTLHAFDQSADMIASVWTPNPGIPSSARQSPWQSMPLPARSAQLVLGDGCTTQLADEQAYSALFTELARILKPGGGLIMRCFIQPDDRESVEQIIDDAYQGAIEHFGSLKWRIAMAQLQTPQGRIGVQTIHDAFCTAFPDRGKLVRATSWPPEIVSTIDVYKGLKTLYSFPTLGELTRMASPFFTPPEIFYGGYELARRCPTLLLRPRAKP